MRSDSMIIENLLKIIVSQQQEIDRLNTVIGKDIQTGLYNRGYCMQLEDNLFINSSVLMFDIDNFKNINDTYGHHFGDKMLLMVASILSKNSRNSDIPIRYGGEEFVLILNGCSLENAYNVAEKIRKEIERSYLTFNGNKVSITVSIGISLKKSDASLWQSIEEADKALYESKATGKNKVTIYQKDKIKRMT